MNQTDQIPATNATGGTATITLHLDSHGGDVTTGLLNWNDSTATIRAALIAAAGVGSDFTVTALGSGTFAGGLNITYKGTLGNTFFASHLDLNSSLTGLATPGSLTQQTAGLQDTWLLNFTYDMSGATSFTVGIAGHADTPVNASLTASQVASVMSGVTGSGVAATAVDSLGNPNGTAVPYTITLTDGNEYTLSITSDSGASPSVSEVNPATPVVYSCYTLATSGTATGGTFPLTHTGSGTDVTGIAYNVDGTTLAANISTATGQSFSLTGGAGTQASPYIITGPAQPVTVPTADFSGLTQGVTASLSTVVPGAPVPSNQGSLLVGVACSIYG